MKIKTGLKIVLGIVAVMGIGALCAFFMPAPEFSSDYPILEYDGKFDSDTYITEGFRLEMEDYNGSITWKIPDDGIVTLLEDGICMVSRPEKNTQVVLTETIKKWNKQSSRQIELLVIGTDNGRDYPAVTKELLRSGYGPGVEMYVNADSDDDDIVYIRGDFGNTFVDSAEDGLRILQAYSELFDIPENTEFELYDISKSDQRISYQYMEVYNGIPLQDSFVVVITYQGGKLCSIHCELSKMDKGNLPVRAEKKLDYAAIIEEFAEEKILEWELKSDETSYITFNGKNYLVDVVYAELNGGQCNYYGIDATSGQVLYSNSAFIYCMPYANFDTYSMII